MGSIFTSRVTETLELPHDPGSSVVIRKLAPRHLEAASATASLKAREAIAAAGGASALKELRTLSSDPDPSAVRPAPDPLAGYDRVVLVQKGLASWSYDVAISPEAIDDLDEETLDFLARAILKLAQPKRFQTGVEIETDRKNV